MCILPVLAASEATVASEAMAASVAMAVSEAMAASEVRYDLIFEISNLSYPVIYVHIASFGGLGGLGGHWWPKRSKSTFRISEVN